MPAGPRAAPSASRSAPLPSLRLVAVRRNCPGRLGRSRRLDRLALSPNGRSRRPAKPASESNRLDREACLERLVIPVGVVDDHEAPDHLAQFPEIARSVQEYSVSRRTVAGHSPLLSFPQLMAHSSRSHVAGRATSRGRHRDSLSYLVRAAGLPEPRHGSAPRSSPAPDSEVRPLVPSLARRPVRWNRTERNGCMVGGASRPPERWW